MISSNPGIFIVATIVKQISLERKDMQHIDSTIYKSGMSVCMSVCLFVCNGDTTKYIIVECLSVCWYVR